MNQKMEMMTSKVEVDSSSEFFKAAAAQLRQEHEAEEDVVKKFAIADQGIRIGVSWTGKSMLYLCQALALAKEDWNQLGLDAQHRIAESFYHYSSERFGTSQSSSTIENYIRVGKAWLVKGIPHLPESTYQFEVEKDGTAVFVTDEEGNAEEVPVDIWDINYSKLLAVTSRAAKGKLEEDELGLLINPKISQQKLIDYIKGPSKPREGKPRETLTYFMVGGWVVVTDGKRQMPILELDDGALDDPLAAQGWQRMVKIMGILNESGDDF